MERVRVGLFLASLAIMGLGCSTAAPSAGLFISNHGGLQLSWDARQVRINAVAAPLTASCSGRKLTVQVLASDAVTAYSLWDGHIFVTRGLMDRLDNAELQAAIAHELGHLLSDGHVQSVASLRGCCVDPDGEVRADAVGAMLLTNQGLSPTAMIRMLQKVEKYGSLPPTCCVAVQHRIGMLSTRLVMQYQASLQ